MKRIYQISILCGIAFLFSSCSTTSIPKTTPEAKPKPPAFVNPFLEGTYEHFKARQDYTKTYDIFRKNQEYAAATPSETSIILNLKTLRGQLLDRNKVVILDYPITPGDAKHPTPKGNYKIIEKIVDKESNLYGKILDANKAVVKSAADSRVDKVPAGGSFDGADMPYWMRLTNSGIGMHQGNVPRYPASHGCIRHTWNGVKQVYAKVKIGTPVTIK